MRSVPVERQATSTRLGHSEMEFLWKGKELLWSAMAVSKMIDCEELVAGSVEM